MKGFSQADRTYIVLTVSYIVSQFYRVSNAVIAPEMMRALRLTPEEMGAITGIFFLAFGVMQLPTGVLLDRIGPRATMSGSALHVMLFLENLIRALLVFNELWSRYCQRALLVYHYRDGLGQRMACRCMLFTGCKFSITQMGLDAA
jgi:sugar phosphate permease